MSRRLINSWIRRGWRRRGEVFHPILNNKYPTFIRQFTNMCQLQQKSLVNCFFASKPRVNTVEHGFGRVPTSCYLPAALGNGKEKKKGRTHVYDRQTYRAEFSWYYSVLYDLCGWKHAKFYLKIPCAINWHKTNGNSINVKYDQG